MLRFVSRGPALLFLLCLIPGFACSAAAVDPAPPAELPAVTVLASPFSASDPKVPSRGILLSGGALSQSPQRTLDSLLRDTPGFRLFRRTDSLGAHPTSQGFSLANVGPNGASRSGLLLDGVPLNDPFGGWVPWSRLPPVLLSAAHIQPRAGVSPWGTGSLGGVLALESRVLGDAPFGLLEVASGNRMRVQSTAAAAMDTSSGRTRLFGAAHLLDFRGYPLVRADQRGKVDVPAGVRSESFDVGMRHVFSEARDWHLTLRALGWREERNTGTPLTRNQSRALDLSLRLVNDAGAGEHSSETLLFGQRRAFSSFFTSITADRSREIPTLSQFAVPAWSWGFLQRLRLVLSDTHTLSTGADMRLTEGRTEELFRYQQNAFTSERSAGGRQWLGGVYLQDVWTPHPKWRLTGGVRWEVLRDSSGQLQERPLAGGGTLVRYASRTLSLPHANLDLNWAAHKMLEWTGSVYTGARGPTLNELYRPFRAGDVSTLANPSLQPESLFGGELEMRVRPLSGLNGALRIFANRLRDTIANLTRVTGPGVFPPWGTLPLGATGARRENIERVDISGIEARLEWRFSEQWVIRANALGTHSRVRECVLAPGLTGKQLPQMPRAQLGAQIEGHEGPWKGLLAVRHVGAQFEDDANRFVLRPFWTLDARVGRAVGKRSEIFVSGENLTNSEIQTRRDSSGIVALGMPRLWSAGLRLEF